MTAFSRLTCVVTLLGVAAWVYAGPPKVIGNRPVRLEVPVPDTEPLVDLPRDQSGAPPAGAPLRSPPANPQPSDRGALAVVVQNDPSDAKLEALPSHPRSAPAELKHAREQAQKCSSISARVVEKIETPEKSY